MVVVDDDSKVRLLLERAFRAPEFETHAFATGAAALRSVAEIRPDCVVSDILMPDMDGENLLRAVRAVPGLERVPFIAVSAVRSEARIRAVLAAGADAFLLKPFPLRDLIEKVRGLVERPATARSGTEMTGDYTSPTRPVVAVPHTTSTAAIRRRGPVTRFEPLRDEPVGSPGTMPPGPSRARPAVPPAPVATPPGAPSVAPPVEPPPVAAAPVTARPAAPSPAAPSPAAPSPAAAPPPVEPPPVAAAPVTARPAAPSLAARPPTATPPVAAAPATSRPAAQPPAERSAAAPGPAAPTSVRVAPVRIVLPTQYPRAPASAPPAERAESHRVELGPPDTGLGFGRFTRVEVRGRSFIVLTEAVAQPRFTVTTIITEKGVPLRKIESALPHPLAREEDRDTVRRQLDLQHDDTLRRLDDLVLDTAPRRVVWSDQSRSVEAGVLAWAMSAVAQLAETEAGTDETVQQLRLTRESALVEEDSLRAFQVTPFGRVVVDPAHAGRLPRRAVRAVAGWCCAFASAALQAEADEIIEPVRQATRRYSLELERMGFYDRLQRRAKA
jgi:CheY-like chemotaxis protein